MIEDHEIKKKHDYLHVTIYQNMNKESIGVYLKGIPEVARESGYSKILVDIRQANIDLTYMDHYQAGEDFARYFQGLSVAFVFNEIKDNYAFGETVASNRGAVLRLFTSLKESYDWLEVNEEN